MKNTLRPTLGYRIMANPEMLLLAFMGLLLVAVVVASPGFFHVETLFNVARESMVNVVFALGVLLVIISGGIDVSFLAIGIFAAYTTCKIVPQDGTLSTAFVPFLIAIAIGVLLGLVNAGVVLGSRVSTLIATLATSAIFMGILFAFIGGNVINTLPEPLRELGQVNLLTAPGAVRGTTRLNLLVVLVVLLCGLLWAFLRYTVAGRNVFAVGGDEEAARRAGISVAGTRVLVFSVAGGLAGLAGLTHVTLSGRADPTTFIGGELDILAAVVIGGALISGGKGSVRGTVLGVILIALIKSALVPLGMPSIWQKAAVGALLLIGVCLQTLAAKRKPERPILEAQTNKTTGTVPA